jgi:mannose-1-phosphate guanylyltransferase
MAKKNQYGLILAGGRGTRFWPRSRRSNPKQILRLFSGQSLIQETVGRLRPVIPPERIWVLTNERLRTEIARQLPDVPRRQILAEPDQRNTAPCLGMAAHILHSLDPDAVLGVFPADHRIAKPAGFRRLLPPAFRAAAEGCIVVIGIQPLWPETGYGYVEFPRDVQPGSLEPIQVLRFREKPDLRTAKRFLAAKHYFWNAGMFFWRADVFLEALRHLQPKMAVILGALPPYSDRRFGALLKENFSLCENISVDYAVLERARNVVGLAAGDIGWTDLGSWNAIYEALPRGPEGNVSRSDAVFIDSGGNYVDAPQKLVALVGVRDLVVVDTADGLLVAARTRSQRVSDVVKLLEARKRQDLL